jgi:hypothetical protein
MNFEKYTEQSGFAILKHCAREGKSHSNKNIDPKRTAENYTFGDNGLVKDFDIEPTSITRKQYKERKSEVYCYKRANVKTICQVIVSAPSDLKSEDEVKFFGTVTAFLCDKFGVDNCLQVVVHKDETTPHLHLSFIPITKDNKHGGEKICAAEVITKKELMSIHNELQTFLGRYGIYNRIVYEKTTN